MLLHTWVMLVLVTELTKIAGSLQLISTVVRSHAYRASRYCDLGSDACKHWWPYGTDGLPRRVILLEDQIECGQRIPTNLQTDTFSVQHITHEVISKTPKTGYTNRHH
jgi:hypothetical protein